MMSYADKEYYLKDYIGKLIPESEIDKYLKLSQEKIDDVTYNRIIDIGFNNLSDFQKLKIKESVCCQADYIYENGFNDDEKSDIASYSVLDITVNLKTNVEKTKAEKKFMSERAYSCIHQTGLDSDLL